MLLLVIHIPQIQEKAVPVNICRKCYRKQPSTVTFAICFGPTWTKDLFKKKKKIQSLNKWQDDDDDNDDDLS